MNPGFKKLASGAFESGLAELNEDAEWRDDRTDLDGPFRLGFPSARGWGEDLLVASLLKRNAAKSEKSVKVIADWQVCSMLKHDSSFRPQLRDDNGRGRSPLAILRHALLGDLLDKPFVPLCTSKSPLTQPISRDRCVGIAWASVSGSSPIPEKSVPPHEFRSLLENIDAEFVSLQRKLTVADPTGLLSSLVSSVIPDDVLDPSTESSVEVLIEEIRKLDYIVTISTTTTHIAAAMGVGVELIAAERQGPQWFWQVQANHQKCIYPSVKVHLGDSKRGNWWKKPIESVRASLSSIA